jgi:hypothetical protein
MPSAPDKLLSGEFNKHAKSAANKFRSGELFVAQCRRVISNICHILGKYSVKLRKIQPINGSSCLYAVSAKKNSYRRDTYCKTHAKCASHKKSVAFFLNLWYNSAWEVTVKFERL